MRIRSLGSNDNFCAVPGRFESHGQPDTAACPRDVDHLPRQLPKQEISSTIIVRTENFDIFHILYYKENYGRETVNDDLSAGSSSM
jgi:hypothetical protein